MKRWFFSLLLFLMYFGRVIGAEVGDPHADLYQYDSFREMVGHTRFCTSGGECGPFTCTVSYNDSSQTVLQFRFNRASFRILPVGTEEIYLDDGWRREVASLTIRNQSDRTSVTTLASEMSIEDLSVRNGYLRAFIVMVTSCLVGNASRLKELERGKSA